MTAFGGVWLPAALATWVLTAPATLWGQNSRVVTGRVVDGRSEDAVVSAMIRLGQSPNYAISDLDGRFRTTLNEPSVQTLVVTAPGYAKRYQPVEPGLSDDLEIRLSPDPIELEGFDVDLLSFRTRLDRRRNWIPHNYALEGNLLSASTADNVWDLVGERHNFHFDGFTDYGCPTARIFEGLTTVALYVDERPVRIGVFQQYRPQDFVLVEVYNMGAQIHAYTQKYLNWMTENSSPPPSFDTLAQLCPNEKPPPGTMKRGRPVGPSVEG